MPLYLIKTSEDDYWREVDVDEFVRAEKAAGFVGGRPGRPCTAGFEGNGVRGRVRYAFDKED